MSWNPFCDRYGITPNSIILEKEMATHSRVHTWRIPGTGEPGGLLSMGSHRVGHDWSDLAAAAAAVPSYVAVLFLSCVWLFCNPMDCNPPGSSVHGISQARLLEWVVISFSRASYWTWDWTHVSCIDRQILYYWVTWEACAILTQNDKQFLVVN